ncbi:MAG: hypothetical protein JWO02_2240, partial [Solirubrobacterales bacterium]|nr:hypothetical protein [Solirubrobacterales bacterium]
MPFWTTARRAAAATTVVAGVLVPAAGALASTVVVDDDKAQCPNAQYTSVQAAVIGAAPYDTVAICAGTYAESAPAFETAAGVVGATNGLLIRKNLTLRGAGADKVLITPAGTAALGGTGAPALADGGGNVVTVARQTLGSTDEEDISVTFSGLTIASPNADVDAGINFINTSGKVINSVVGPFKNAGSGAPLGWGVTATNSYLGTTPPTEGAPKRRVAVTGSAITGFGAGGIKIDGSTETAPTTRSGIVEIGEISDSVVDGGAAATGVRSGIELHAGARGFVTGTKIANVTHATTPRNAVGLLLTDADIPNVSITNNNFGPNGYGLFNASADNSAVRLGAKIVVTGNFFGTGGPTPDPAIRVAGREAVSGPDTGAVASVAASPFATEPVGGVPTSGARATVDTAPAVQIVDPLNGATTAAGSAFDVLTAATDDFDVTSVTVLVDGVAAGTDTVPPYTARAVVPGTAAPGSAHTITAIATDSSG